MDFLVGIVGDGFTLVAADMNTAHSILKMKSDTVKTHEMTDRFLMLCAGDYGDSVHFSEYIQKNIKLYSLRTGVPLSSHAIANFTRSELASALRSRNAYQVNMLLAGHDDRDGPCLYYMDYLSAMAKIPYACHGYGAHFCFSTLDRVWKPNMNIEEAKEALRMCIHELRTRFLMDQGKFQAHMVSKDGIKEVDLGV
eukprot:Nk52_evm97s217 gene=Nk52_evmTU97s217